MKRIDRQKGALARFKILPMQEWINQESKKVGHVINADSAYENYVARKEQERAALINRTSSY